ncbi:hypothetical protein [Cysteiniphilum litorale]|uniref:hypothetical protein n=1 Tax=Cysteiniphilum litorale TaxID=2056700 RepID=UPI003F88430A
MKYGKIKPVLALVTSSLFLYGCSSGSSTDYQQQGSSLDGYVISSENIDSTQSAYTKLPVNLSMKHLNIRKENNAKLYSIITNGSKDITINNVCQNIPIGDNCDLLISNIGKYNVGSDIKLDALIDGNKTSISTTIHANANNLWTSRDKNITLPLNQVIDFSVLNTSTIDSIVFNQPVFTSNSAANDNDSVNILNNSCITQLSPGQTCSFDIIATKSISGAVTLSEQLLPIANITFGNTDIEDIALKPLPENTQPNINYPVIYQLINKSSSSISDLAIKSTSSADNAFAIKADSSCITKTTLAAGESCLIELDFKGDMSDTNYFSDIDVTYSGGEALKLKLHTYTHENNLTVSYLNSLPDNILTGITYPFTYEVSNRSEQPIDIKSLTDNFDSDKGIVINPDQSNCLTYKSGGTIDISQSCRIAGKYITTDSTRNALIASTISPVGAANVNIINHAHNIASALTIKKDLEIPDNILPNSQYHFKYQIINSSPETAQDLIWSTATSNYKKLEFTNNSCQDLTSLASGESCIIEGDVTSGELTTGQTIAVYNTAIAYKGAKTISIGTISQITNAPIQYTRIHDIPKATISGTTFNFEYQFTNVGTEPATGVKFYVSAEQSDGFIVDKDNSSCNTLTTLKSGESCSWKGQFKPLNPNNDIDYRTIAIAATYNEGQSTTLTSTSKISSIDINHSSYSITKNNANADGNDTNMVDIFIKDSAGDLLEGVTNLLNARAGDLNSTSIVSVNQQYQASFASDKSGSYPLNILVDSQQIKPLDDNNLIFKGNGGFTPIYPPLPKLLNTGVNQFDANHSLGAIGQRFTGESVYQIYSNDNGGAQSSQYEVRITDPKAINVSADDTTARYIQPTITMNPSIDHPINYFFIYRFTLPDSIDLSKVELTLDAYTNVLPDDSVPSIPKSKISINNQKISNITMLEPEMGSHSPNVIINDKTCKLQHICLVKGENTLRLDVYAYIPNAVTAIKVDHTDLHYTSL